VVVLLHMLSRTLESHIQPLDRHSYQFAAILGDLEHKRDVYLAVHDFGQVPEQYFTNSHQARWLRSFRSDLVPPPASPGQPPSDHTLGTVFEFHYYSDISFRLLYLSTFQSFECQPLPLETLVS